MKKSIIAVFWLMAVLMLAGCDSTATHEHHYKCEGHVQKKEVYEWVCQDCGKIYFSEDAEGKKEVK